ncbi:MAG: beta strand repeat-containing protein [Janthinobacterium lividum]
MKQPTTIFRKLLLLALALGTGYTSWGQTYSQVPLTASSFTADVIANGAAALPASSSTTADADGAGFYLMSQDYFTATTAHTSGIPNSGLIPNSIVGLSALTYQLASLSANNSLRLAGASSGTLTFATPTAASEVYVLSCSGSGASTSTITVTYSDGTTTSFTGQTYPDWYGGSATQNVFGMTGRASTSTTAPVSTPYTAAGTAPFLDQLKLTIPTNKMNTTISSITVANATAGVVLNVMAVSIGTYPICSATPTNLAAVATSASGGTTALTTACSSTNIFLSVTGLPSTTTAGYTYQWQSSTTSATTGFTNIAGATSSTYTATGQTVATYYRVVVACLYDGAGGTAVNSSAVQVAQSPATSCYCVPARTSTSTSYATVTGVLLPGDNGITLNSAPGLLVSTSPGYVSTSYAVYPASTTAPATTTTLTAGNSYTLTVGVPSLTRVSAWIDFDQSGTFDASEFFILRSGTALYGSATVNNLTATIALPATATAGTTKLRIRTDYYGNTVLNTFAGACTNTTYGQSMDYTVTLVAGTACTFAAPPTASASVTGVCAGTGFTLTATTPAGVTGLMYQWMSSPAGTNTFTNLGAAQTSPSYTVTGITASTDYKVAVYCPNGGQQVASNTVSVAFSYLNCYCTPVSTGTNEYIKSVALPGTPGFTNASNANSTSGYGDFTTNAALTTTLTQGSTYTNGINVIGHLNSTNAQAGMWIDYDHSGTFDASEYMLLGIQTAINADYTFTATLMVPATALLGQTRVRVRQRNGSFSGTDACTSGTTTWYGETEDYFITIVAPTTCSAPPATVTATADVTNACANLSFTLSTSSVPTTLGGYSYQWQSRTGTNAFANIAGATTNPYTVASQTVATDYQLVVSCQYGGTPVTSNIVSVGQNSFNQCYCTASSTNVCSNYGVITSVALGTIVNASGCTSTNSYSDYTAISTNLAAGSTNTLTLGVASATSTFNYNYGVWIDFNQNGTFEASEFVASSTTPVSATSATITIAIPALSSTVLSGPTRIRIRTNAGIASYGVFTATGANNACGAVYNGETEDYTVNIVTCTPSTATFSYGTSNYCVSGTTSPAVVLATGATAGTYSSTTGLTISATTGAITLSSSTPGMYTVTNTVPATGTQCSSTATTTVTVTAAPTAGFSYAASPYCASGTTSPTPTMTTGATAGTFSSTTGLTVNATTGAITLSSSTPGTYTVTNTVAAANGCAAVTSTQSVIINAAPTAGFSYPTTTACAGTATTLTPTLTTGATAGTYSLPTATGLSINATTGAITVGATAPAGTYTVTNTVAASGGCAGTSSTASFTLTAPTTATFSYAGSPFCKSSTTTPTPTITGTAGGTFSSTSGLSINASTGVITLSSSTAGTYVVTYTVAGTCGSSSTQSVTITAPQTAGFSYATPASGMACAGGNGSFAAVLATGATAGTFSVSPLGATVNATTGALSLAGAAAGTYTVTNTVAASGGCAASTSTATFTVNPLPATPVLTPSGTAATGITLTSSSTTGNQFYLNGVAVTGATGQTLLVNSGTKNGSYTVVATSAAGCASSASAAVSVTVTATAGAQNGASLRVYPNPTHDGLLTLELSGYREAVSVRIANALGQVVYTGEVNSSALAQPQVLNLSGLATGVYVLQARTASGEVQTRRIVRD